MSKSWQEVSAILLAVLVGTGVITYTDLFSGLFELKGMSYVYTEDSYCYRDCEAYINVTTTYWRVCFAHYEDTKYENETLFKKVSRSRTLHINLNNIDNVITTEPRVEVDWLVPARGKGNWRPLKDGDCWDRLKTNKIKLIGHKEPGQTIKWSFKTGEYIDIDPLWIDVSELNTTIKNVTITDKITQLDSCRDIYYDEITYKKDIKEIWDNENKTNVNVTILTKIITEKSREVCEKIGFEIEDKKLIEYNHCCFYLDDSVLCKLKGHADCNNAYCSSGENCQLFNVTKEGTIKYERNSENIWQTKSNSYKSERIELQ